GLTRVGAGQVGDVVLMRSGPGQLHLGVLTARGMVHADAMLRRVVERPGPPPWPVIGIWRAQKGD
ncbi:MAG TPA: peptidoglycan endopeptidase, partial [Sphingomonas sp.]|nr:peptidoglycan endopeptidase [Sphingomonas sp.]